MAFACQTRLPAFTQLLRGSVVVSVSAGTGVEEGYDLLGYSSFRAGSVPPEQLLAHGRNVRADVVIVYTRGMGRLRDADSLPDGADPAFYDYFAAYWTKLPPQILWPARAEEPAGGGGGLRVMAVIRHSPAALAGMESGDILLQLGDTVLQEPAQLVEVTGRLAGQSADAVILRDGQRMQRSLILNSAR